MQKLTPEETARVFAMYAPCKIYQGSWFPQLSMYRDLIAFDFGTFQSRVLLSNGESYWFSFTEIKLLLTPLDKITEAHSTAIANIAGWEHSQAKEGKKLVMNLNYADLSCAYSVLQGFDIFQQLILWGYAVPLFFGLNHWANGKTAIELGIAIESN